MVVITVQTKQGPLNYIENRHQSNYEAKHRLRLKETILGELFTYYNKGMNFTNSEILIDNREKKIITGITVKEQMTKAKKIIEEEVIPRNNKYNKLKR